MDAMERVQFTPQDLDAIAGMCETELVFLRHCEAKGIPTARQQAVVALVRAKAIDELEALRKVSRAKAIGEEKK